VSDTPRTDELGRKIDEGRAVGAEALVLAMQLERENAALRAAIDAARKEKQ
jgi:hypothetical protein